LGDWGGPRSRAFATSSARPTLMLSRRQAIKPGGCPGLSHEGIL
jgi:hypothetical protein